MVTYNTSPCWNLGRQNIGGRDLDNLFRYANIVAQYTLQVRSNLWRADYFSWLVK